MKSQLIKGGLLVGAGAACYGLLATFVRLAYNDGYRLADVTMSQFMWGILGLILLNLFTSKKKTEKQVSTSKGNPYFKLMITGTSLGMTSTFYYMSVQYIPVSLAIVMLMQTVWLGVVVEMILYRQKPSLRKIIAVVFILLGTILSTNVMETNATVDWRGIAWGFLAALSYTFTVFANNKVGTEFHPFKRTLWMLLGGFVIVLIASYQTILTGLKWDIFLSYGLILALFGTILPPILFNYGMPLTGMGLGAILSAIEIPVSVLMAFFILNEQINPIQWIGILLILIMVIYINIPQKK